MLYHRFVDSISHSPDRKTFLAGLAMAMSLSFGRTARRFRCRPIAVQGTQGAQAERILVQYNSSHEKPQRFQTINTKHLDSIIHRKELPEENEMQSASLPRKNLLPIFAILLRSWNKCLVWRIAMWRLSAGRMVSTLPQLGTR